MFQRILIANRGEIACRVIDTCRRLGVETVAVFSDADRDARHVDLADRAIRVGGAAPADSYLRGDRIIAAAQQAGAQAIHPGYGFLSENPDFVEAVEAAGLVFIGPSADAIRAMGLKDAAKALMVEAGVPVVPGYHGADQGDAHLAQEAAKIGYPVLIKAVAGGGGKGMRRVDAPADFAGALDSARAEARGAFGNDAVLVEKYVEKPRHIEVQVFGDGTRAIHLHERDCSLQRRHQKVVEEAPAPGMTPDLRAAMGAAAVRAAQAIGYAGAGTVEFIVDAGQGLREDGFFFMEMNTRLQVEHPVTEAIAGVDLVEWQLRVAAGEPLPMAQDDIALNGHAVEVRLYAEDVPAGFLPATGRLTHLEFPGDVRVDTGVRAGDAISPHYDPMIAKIVTHGADRAEALNRMRGALAATQVAGCVTNHGFLRNLLDHPGFLAGEVDTGLIGRDLDALAAVRQPGSRIRALGVVVALGLDRPQAPLAGFSLWQPVEHPVRLLWGGAEFDARAGIAADGIDVTLDETCHHVARHGAAWWIDGEKTPARIVTEDVAHAGAPGGPVWVFLDDGYRFDSPDPLAASDSEAAAGDVVTAPMPGVLRAVLVGPGQAVSRGERLAVLEAMKMEHALSAPRDGVVAVVHVDEGSQVEAGAPLVELEEPAENPA